MERDSERFLWLDDWGVYFSRSDPPQFRGGRRSRQFGICHPHHHLVVRQMARLLEDSPEYSQVGFHHAIINRHIKIIVCKVRTVVNPRKQRSTNQLLLSLELTANVIRINIAEDFEVILQYPSQGILNGQVRFVWRPHLAPQKVV